MERIKPQVPCAHVRFSESEDIVARLNEAFDRFGSRLAVKDAHASLTYTELDHASDRVAAAIQADSMQRDLPVVIFLEHSASYLASMVGAVKSGRPFIPLDYWTPPERVEAVRAESGAPTLLVSDASLKRLGPLPAGMRAVNLDHLDGAAAPAPVDFKPTDPINIFYTSGSTGRPKGVTYARRNLYVNSCHHITNYHFNEQDRLALLMSFSFGASLGDGMGMLLAGGSMHIRSVRDEGLASLADWLRQERITVIHVVSTLFRNIAGHMDGRLDLPCLRLAIVGGETTYPSDVKLFQRHFPHGCLLRLGMGITEACATTAIIFIGTDTPFDDDRVPVGYPASDTETIIVDDDRRELPPGQIGRMLFRGRYLSPGYWKRPELTSESFRDTPGVEGVREFLSGDLGRRNAGGCLWHMGRADFQLKIRGHRVETAEVEGALLEIPGVAHAAVVARPDRHGDNRLAAYLVPAEAPGPTVSALRAGLAKRLPEYMLPSTFVFLEKMPQTDSGKVNRKALPGPEETRPRLDVRCVAPRNDLELRLARLWEETLGVHPVGVQDNFFELGGNSLLAARLFAEIEREFKKDAPVTTLFRAPTVERLAEALSDGLPAGRAACMVPIQTGASLPPLFVMDARNAGIFVHLARRLGAERPVYGLHPHGLDENGEKLNSTAAVARRYLREVRALQPNGPYHIAGLCAGGVVAFEMARQLVESGEQVAFLALLDAFCPHGRILPYDVSRLLRKFRHRVVRPLTRYVRRLSAAPAANWRAVTRDALAQARAGRKERDLFREERSESRESWGRYLHAMRDDLHRLRKLHGRAVLSYQPKEYPGKVLLLLAEETTLDGTLGPRLGWKRWAKGGVDAAYIPGSHHHMLEEPNVALVAEEFLKHL